MVKLKEVREAFMGLPSGALVVNTKLIVDFGEIRVVKLRDVDSEELKKKFDVKVEDMRMVMSITPSFLREYSIMWTDDEELRKRLGEWFNKNFKKLLKEVFGF